MSHQLYIEIPIQEKAYSQIIGKCRCHNLSILEESWESIRACLSKTVAPDFCIRIAKEIRCQNGVID